MDKEAEMDGVIVRRWRIVYRVALYAEMSQDRQTITLSGGSEEEALAALRRNYPPDCVDVLTVQEIE
jgi:hypothetical protein